LFKNNILLFYARAAPERSAIIGRIEIEPRGRAFGARRARGMRSAATGRRFITHHEDKT
jgi:hypothetical protein